MTAAGKFWCGYLAMLASAVLLWSSEARAGYYATIGASNYSPVVVGRSSGCLLTAGMAIQNASNVTTSITSIDMTAHKLRPDLAAFIRLALNTGCRKTELLLLRWSDVDIERRYILLRPENTKGNKRRILPLNTGAIQALKQQKQQSKTEWVFARQNGDRVKTFNWLFRKAAQQAGIEDFRIHDLRHTFASWLVSEGVELVKVRDLLGHSSIKMTERYAHLMPDRLLGAVSVLDLFETS